MATQMEISTWAQYWELPYCVVEEYVNEHNGALPTDLEDLCAWGTNTERRSSTGDWTCKGSVSATSSLGLPGKESVENWVRSNPMTALAIAFAAGALVLSTKAQRGTVAAMIFGAVLSLWILGQREV